jgi:hypothetical protein
LSQNRSLARNIDSKNSALGFDCCPRAARRRLYRQHRPKAAIAGFGIENFDIEVNG